MTVEVAVLGSPSLIVLNYGLCGRKATLNLNCSNSELKSCVSDSRSGRPGLPVPNSQYGLCERKATVNLNCSVSELRTCVKVKVAVPGLPSPSQRVLMVSVDVKQH